MSRTPFIAGNWKLNKTIAEAEEYIQALLPKVGAIGDVEIVICPPYTALQAMVDSARGSSVQVYAQSMHEADDGAFTGEVSAPMLTEIDVQGVILGHSERRQYYNETDRALQQKVPKALESGLMPILCVGETEEERERGDTERKLRHQVQEGLEKVPKDRLAEVVIAYEPIWAIGTGLIATPDQAQEAIAFVRALVEDRDKAAGKAVRILYGGSLKPDNAPELLALPDVDGALVGGASLDAASFAEIVEAARRERRAHHPRRLGPRPGRAGERDLARRHAGVRRAVGGAPAHPADGQGRGRRPARGPDGQLGGRPPQPRRRRDRAAGPGADRQGGRGRLAGRHPRA